jgi:membrane fusion protein (multidrug efflux system)
MGKHRRLTRVLAVVGGLVLFVVLLAVVKGAQIGKLVGMGKQMEKLGPPPEAVGSAVARGGTWETTLSAVGSVASLKSVSVSNELPGVVSRVRFESGSLAKEGQVLVELEASVERAQLASAEARRDLAAKTAERSEVLSKGNVISRAQYDDTQTQLRAAESDLEGLKAQVARKVVRAPFAGRLGIRAVNVGQYLTPGTTVTTLDAIGGTFVDFTLPQEDIPSVAVGMPVQVTFEGTAAAAAGTITAVDPTVDPTTRAVKIRAQIPEAGAAETGAKTGAKTGATIRPGMFVNVKVVQPKKQAVVAVPLTAIIHASFGDSVFVVEPKKPGSPGMAQTPEGKPVKIARQQFVRLGQTRGDFVAIAKGVQAGQEVVTEGAFKLRNNAPIVVDNSVKPDAGLDPHPENR